MITGTYDRRFLTKEILDFCGTLPIYNTEHIKEDASNGNKTTSKHAKFEVLFMSIKTWVRTLDHVAE